MEHTEKMTPEELTTALAQYTGTENYYKFSMLSRLVLSDGVKFLCEQAQCYWLMDIVASYQSRCMKDGMLRDMQFWTLKVDLKKHKGIVTCDRDSGNTAITQRIPNTDFPLSEIKIWVANGVIYLPSEH